MNIPVKFLWTNLFCKGCNQQLYLSLEFSLGLLCDLEKDQKGVTNADDGHPDPRNPVPAIRKYIGYLRVKWKNQHMFISFSLTVQSNFQCSIGNNLR